jgi:predicted RNase H-like nuclease (RuvC/YqgF family)
MSAANARLTESLQTLEKRLETPVVPGELTSWAGQAAAALCDVERELREQIEEMHPRQYREIHRQDEGLARRVEQLQEHDAQLLEILTEVRRISEELKTKAERVEPDERRAADAHHALIENGLQLVIAARTQEEAISTWYTEAFARDRGEVD